MFGISLGGSKEKSSYLDSQKQYNTMSPLIQGQSDLMRALIQNYVTGGGDYGFGGNVNQAIPTLNAAYAARGIRPNSGVAAAGLGSMVAQAMAMAALNRQQVGQSLATGVVPFYNSYSFTRRAGEGKGSNSSFSVGFKR